MSESIARIEFDTLLAHGKRIVVLTDEGKGNAQLRVRRAIQAIDCERVARAHHGLAAGFGRLRGPKKRRLQPSQRRKCCMRLREVGIELHGAEKQRLRCGEILARETLQVP